ncbi:PREDICTED: U-box domain-containing protein 21-like [Camelina sativa]|uniref:U-box domain-containing protein n=1 Tax=Camelina sativa TaxID=90675 RepID=A0ABM0VZT4_CAMSA|nr:PREDICTED: U-box domain-containing protein 21-like [Camelina sativa]
MVLPWRSSGGGVAKRRNQLTSGDISVVETKIPAQIRSSSRMERIRSPRVQLTPRDAVEISRRLENASARKEYAECFELVSKIKNLGGGGGDTNKKYLVQNGCVLSLSSCFETFSEGRDIHVRLLEEILYILSSWLPLSRSEGFSKMGSTASLDCLVRFLNSTDAKTRQNAAFCIREVIAVDKRYVNALTDTEGACEGLVKIIRDSVSTSSTKASLMVIYRAVSCNDKIATRFVRLGLVELITEMMVNNNAEKSVCERSLVVLNATCDNEQGKEDVLRNALIVPLLVKKILRVSDLATQCSVSILWKLWKNNNGQGDDRLLVEALQVGAFEKLLVLLQVGCEEKTKEKASELLRNLNRCRNEIEKTNCVESSMHLKNVKKSF